MIADLFIKRPKFAIVIAILMILAGGFVKLQRYAFFPCV